MRPGLRLVIAFATLTVACGGGRTATPRDEPVRPAPAPSVPAFVVYTSDATYVLPADGSTPTHAPGWLLYAVRDEGGPVWTSESPAMEEPEAEELEVDEEGEPCEESFYVPISIVGGSIESLGARHTWCGFNRYEALSRTWTVVPPAPGARVEDAFEPVGCGECGGPPDLGPDYLDWSLDGCRWDESVAGDVEDACRDCVFREVQADVTFLRRGDLWLVETHLGNGVAWYSRAPARPGRCPSPEDPCGDPSAFPALAETEDEFWVATDGSVALEIDAETYRLHYVDGRSAIERPLPSGREALFGARFHSDARALIRALEGTPP